MPLDYVLVEGVGFEPTGDLRRRRFSRLKLVTADLTDLIDAIGFRHFDGIAGNEL
jgi:hypothetical protein